MKAGKSNLNVGDKVVLHGIKGDVDNHLNGLTGTVTHPFAFGITEKGWVGIYLKFSGKKINVKETECVVLHDNIKIRHYWEEVIIKKYDVVVYNDNGDIIQDENIHEEKVETLESGDIKIDSIKEGLNRLGNIAPEAIEIIKSLNL